VIHVSMMTWPDKSDFRLRNGEARIFADGVWLQATRSTSGAVGAAVFVGVAFGLRAASHRVSSLHMAHLTYQRAVVGYHGCDASVVEEVLAGKAELMLSTNAYDWLGEGMYFWEHGPQRRMSGPLSKRDLAGRR